MEARGGSNAIFYPYCPSPPRRGPGAPPAAIYAQDLAFRRRPAEVPWQQRLYLGTILAPALRQAAAVLVPTETTHRDLLAAYPVPGLERRVTVVPEGLGSSAAPGPLPERIEPGFIIAGGTVEPRKNYPRPPTAYRRLSSRPSLLPISLGPR